MPEYLSPGVYIEETSYRAKSIQGVATSTAGFVGLCRSGPTEGSPPLVTSFEEFRRMFGGIEDLLLANVPTTNYMAHAVKSFFDNGGQRVYIARIFGLPPTKTQADFTAKSSVFVKPSSAAFMSTSSMPLNPRFVTRSPGTEGNLPVKIDAIRSGNLLIGSGASKTITGVRPGDVVEVVTAGSGPVPAGSGPKSRAVSASDLAAKDLYWVKINDAGSAQLFNNADGSGAPLDISGAVAVQRVTLAVTIGAKGDRLDAYNGLSTHPSSSSYIATVMRHDEPEDRTARVYFGFEPSEPPLELSPADFGDLLMSLITAGSKVLTGGGDGVEPSVSHYEGGGTDTTVTGLVALGDVDDIAIIAAPGSSALTGNEPQNVRSALITHCEKHKYRFAILSAPENLDAAGIRDARGQHDTTYAALYYPWVTSSNPLSQTGELLSLPPEGSVAGVYARSDVERGVHKAPANEVVRDALRFSKNVNKGQQDTLNPEGINCLRYLEGRGYRVWGARTMTSDPEWMYVNVRRLFIYLEHSIDKSTQWAVFEPNNESLWLKIRLTIESFLLEVWRSGALMGTTPNEAFFVRCDRTTMTQSDLDNGRLIVFIGVAPTKPAEFVIFRIGQWTADASTV